MDLVKLSKHVNLCKRNLKSPRVKCCANCPFEQEILTAYPELKQGFEDKRNALGRL